MTSTPAVVNKATYELFETISVGDRAQTWDGIWGTITDLTFECAQNGAVLGAWMVIASNHLPTFDEWGWPKSYAGTITRSVHRFSSDLRDAYTPPAS